MNDNLSPGDTIDIRVDFERNRIYFFRNNVIEWFMCPSRVLQQVGNIDVVNDKGTLYPCIAMAVGGKVVLKNDEKPNLCIYSKLNDTLAMLLCNHLRTNYVIISKLEVECGSYEESFCS